MSEIIVENSNSVATCGNENVESGENVEIYVDTRNKRIGVRACGKVAWAIAIGCFALAWRYLDSQR